MMYGAPKPEDEGVPYARTIADSTDPVSDPVGCSNTDVQYRGKIRVFSLLCVIFGIVEFYTAIPIYNFLNNVKLGAWWGVVMVIIAGVTSGVGQARGWIVIGCVCAGIGAIVGLIGALTDYIAAQVFLKLDSCGQAVYEGETQSANLKFYGNPDTYWGVENCFDSELSFHSVQTNNCYCTRITPAPMTDDITDKNANNMLSGGTISSCGFYKLSDTAIKDGYNCDSILTWYGQHLDTSGVLLFGATLVCFILSIVSCCSLCCGRPKEVNVFTTTHLQQALLADE